MYTTEYIVHISENTEIEIPSPSYNLLDDHVTVKYLTPKSKSTIKLHFTSQFKQSVSLHSVRTPVFHDPDSSSGSFYYIHGRDVNGGHCVSPGGLLAYSIPHQCLC